MKTLYEMFGVAENADDAAIDAAWKRLMRLYHPDVNPQADQRIAQEINAARDFLKDPEKRANYDAQLRARRRPQLVRSGYAVAGTYVITVHSWNT